MPLYEYQCEACGKRFEVIQKFSDPPVEVCRSCGKGPVQRLPSSPAIQFKGTGWYITDYAQKGKPEDGAKEKSKTDETKTDTAAKTETTTKADAPAASSTTTTTTPSKD
jgi:putative FmdB family regulatory protein